MKPKNYIFPIIIILLIVSSFYLTLLRYQNQNLLPEKYNFLKTGNILNNAFFLLLLIFSFLNLFSKARYPLKTVLYFLILSIIIVGDLFFSGLSYDKDVKVVTSSIFLFLASLMLISLITTYFTKSRKIHIFRDIVYTLLIGIIGFVINVIQIYSFKDDYDYITSSNITADAGVILGAAVWGGNRPSPVFRERINKGFELYEKKIVPRLVLTGGGYGGELAEAEVAKNELIRYGINENHLIVEKESFSTIEQIFFVRDILYNRYKWNRIIIISDGFHLFRSRELCRFNNMNVLTVSTDTPLTTESTLNFCIKESIAVLFFWFFGIG